MLTKILLQHCLKKYKKDRLFPGCDFQASNDYKT
uniref:Uncharacterized protein n=1 Tax=Anguilla anguilla TaxID=7936 RepID=A0A0E9U2F9_ANGAN